MSRQILKTYQSIKQNVGDSTDRFVQDYSAVKNNLDDALKLIESMKTLSGPQTPEGNVTSNLSQIFIDTTGAPTSVTMYFNESVGANTGWVVVV
tara:strand:+ start:991 stop:1272 length:282 start_codon:yes stop_codon:yes gene_type:complete